MQQQHSAVRIITIIICYEISSVHGVLINYRINKSWTLTKNEETCLDAFEMKGLRRILRGSWTVKKTK